MSGNKGRTINILGAPLNISTIERPMDQMDQSVVDPGQDEMGN